MTIDEKVLDEKIKTGKELSKEEETHIMQSEGAVDGYTGEIEDIPSEEFDNPEDASDDNKSDDKKSSDEDDSLDKKRDDKSDAETQSTQTKDKESGEEENIFVKLERELAKPEGQENLKALTDREKAYFHQMRRDRKRAQKAEGELDVERRSRLKAEEALKKTSKEKEEEEVDPLEALKKKDPTDYLTVAEVTALVEKMNAPKRPKVEENNRPSIDPRQMRYLNMCEKEARETHAEDFDAVMELTEDIINNNPQHLIEVAKAMQAGENPALKAYELIKADSEFAKLFPVAKTKIEARNNKKPEEKKKETEKKETVKPKVPEDADKVNRVKKAEEALEKNSTKTKTTANLNSSGETTGGGLSLDEVQNMSDREFSKLPKHVRNKFLKQMENM